MDKIPTAEQLIDGRYPDFEALESGNIWSNIEELMVEFAKEHVKAALEVAVGNAMIDAEPVSGRIVTRKEFDFDDRGMVCPYNLSINKQSILNAYPLDNIK